MELRLLVILTPDIDRLTGFCQLLGLEFDHHKHERSPYHYSAAKILTEEKLSCIKTDQRNLNCLLQN